MYPAIRSYDEQAFDMSEESEKKKKLYHLEIVAACSKSRHGWVAKKQGGWLQSPVREPSIRIKTRESELAEEHPIKDTIK